MLQNYLTVAFRNLWKNKLYTLINVLGMGIGIAAIVWGYQNYRFCFSFDNFHAAPAQIYRGLVFKEGNEAVQGIFPMTMVKAAKEDFASISEVVRLDSRGINIKGDKSEPFSQQVHFTDPAFFQLFNFPSKDGNLDAEALGQILSDKGAVLITEEMAEKFFGREEPVGKTLSFYAGESIEMPLTVKGVLKNPPSNSSIRFQFLTRFDNQYKMDGTLLAADDHTWFLDAAFFKIQNPADAARLTKDFKKYLPTQNAARQDFKVTGFSLTPIVEATNASQISSNNLADRPEDSAAYGPFVLAALIFLSACLNFANTTVARSNRRLREMGVRKALGGTQSQLMRQMLLESSAIVLLAIVVSMQLNQWWLPFYNSMFEGVNAEANYLQDSVLLGFLGAVLIGATLLAGAYPAFYVSRFNPSRIFSGTVKFGGTNLFSRILLGFQVVVSLITVISAMAFSKNAEFQRTYDYGYDKENVMIVSVQDENTYSALRNAVQQLPSVDRTAGTRHHIGFGYRKVSAEAKGEEKETAFMAVGENYLDLMKLKMVAGRGFDLQKPSDFENALLVTQKFAALYGWKDAEVVGQQVRIDTITYAVVGTLKDFHVDNLFDPMEPVAMKLVRPEKYTDLIISAKPGELTSTFDQVKAAWAKLFPLKPFNGSYQNEVTARAMNVTTSIAKIFSWFAIISMLLTATGLFALVSLTVQKKMKEIAVRRVVGASSAHVMALVNRGYFWIFLVAAAIGCYGGYALTQLLMDMIFKINVGVGVSTIVVSSVAVLVIALATVGVKVWQAIRMNPGEVLRGD